MQCDCLTIGQDGDILPCDIKRMSRTESDCIYRSNFAAQSLHDERRHGVADISDKRLSTQSVWFCCVAGVSCSPICYLCIMLVM